MFFKALRALALPGGVVGLLVLALPPVRAANYSVPYSDDYANCAGALLGVGIAPDVTAANCAKVLYPTELSTCVVRIKNQTPIAALDALGACVQVRRPIDMATCVVDIDKNTQSTVPPDVLETCRRSLLPVRFSECVVGLRQKITDLEPTRALSTCIDALDRPNDIFPSFIPITPAR